MFLPVYRGFTVLYEIGVGPAEVFVAEEAVKGRERRGVG